MSHTTNQTIAPISKSDVQTVTGDSRDKLKQLCTSESIKPWARYKPVEYRNGDNTPYIKTLTEAHRASVYYGFTNIPTWISTQIGRMLNFWFGIDTSASNAPRIGVHSEYWKYNRPSSAFRLQDFVADPSEYPSRGYFHGARPPIGALTVTTIKVSSKGECTILFNKYEEGVSAGLTVTYEDIPFPGLDSFSLANFYFGAAIYNTETGTVAVITQDTKMSSFQEMGAHVKPVITDADYDGADCWIFPFLSSELFETLQSSPNTQGNYIPLIDKMYATFDIRYARFNIYEFLIWRNSAVSSRLVYYSVGLTNTEGDVYRDYTLSLTFYKSDGVTIFATKTVTGGMAGGASDIITGSLDVAELGGPENIGVGRVQCQVTTADVIFKSSSSAVTDSCPDGPPR